MQPTLIHEPSETLQSLPSMDVSRANVGVVAGTRRRFSEETASLLRSRLLAAATANAVVLTAATIGKLVNSDFSLLWLQVLILLITSATAAVLSFRSSFTLKQLWVGEGVVFGAILVLLCSMLVARFMKFTNAGDAVSVASVQQQFLMAWSVLIFVYGTLMPNSLKRGAIVMLAMATLPYILIAVQSALTPELAALLDADRAHSPLPFPFVAALVATYATHVISAARREAFKAKQLGQYRLKDHLGSGGMGEVYRAEHVLLKRPCAIKLIKSAGVFDANAIARFEKEVQATARLTHCNTVDVYDYGRTEDDTFYYVMELLPGMSLAELMEGYGPVPASRCVYLLRQICSALSEAHGAGLVHRDIKPGNIFVSERGRQFDVAKLLDFGLVKGMSDTPGESAAGISGTPLYMPPEQSLSYDSVDGRADLYALGSVAYHMLTGKPPFPQKGAMDLIAAHQNDLPIKPSDVAAEIPEDLEAIILKCMSKKPAERFQSSDELYDALGQTAASGNWKQEEARSWWQNRKAPSPLQIPTALVQTEIQAR